MDNTSPTHLEHQRQLARLRIRVAAAQRILNHCTQIINGELKADERRPSAADQVLAILSAPGGMLRTQAQLATICGIKDRTVAWAMSKLKASGAVHRRADARWSTTEDHLRFSKLTGEDRLDAYVMNELEWRFRNPRLVHDLGRDLDRHDDIGGADKYAASINRLVMAGKVHLGPDGKVVRPTIAGNTTTTSSGGVTQ